MNKRGGFTLIELLAVIVILAIIAVIAVPIVLNIIDESKESATLRSAEMYLDAVELSIADMVMHHGSIADDDYSIMSNGNICLKEYLKQGEIETCGGKPLAELEKENILEVEVKGEKPTSGSIYIKGGQIFKEIDEEVSNKKTILVIGGNTIEPIKGEDGKVKFGIVVSESIKEETIEVGKMSICNPLNVQTEGAYTAGDKYECDVDPNKEGYDYTFYVLKATETEVNLIMDQNINSDGTKAGITAIREDDNPSRYNLVRWNGESDQETNGYGPVTAMNFLYNATKDWTNIDPLNYSYNDKTTQGTTSDNTSYISFISTNGNAVITTLSGSKVTIGTSDQPLRARMPIYSSDTNITEVTNSSNGPFLYDNLDSSDYTCIMGYWTLSTYSYDNTAVWNVYIASDVSYIGMQHGDSIGVRPVINLSI